MSKKKRKAKSRVVLANPQDDLKQVRLMFTLANDRLMHLEKELEKLSKDVFMLNERANLHEMLNLPGG